MMTSDNTPTPRRRWRRALAWTGGVLGALVVAVAGLGGYFVYAPETPEPELAAAVVKSSVAAEGRDRTYTAVVPDNLEHGAPLWVALHGSRMDSAGMRSATGYQLDELAAEHGFVVVYPDGHEMTWHDCRADTSYAARIDGVDDVTFLEALVDEVAREYSLDTTRVYGLGFSNGAHMLYRMAAESPGTFAGIEVNAANVSTPGTSTCGPITEPLPVILVEGTGDPINPYEGGEAGMFGQNLGSVLSAEESALTLAQTNGVAGDMRRSVVGGEVGEPGAVTLTVYGQSTDAPVLLYSVEGGGHAVPNPVTILPRVMGGGTDHLNAPAAAWELFSGIPAAG